MFRHALRNLMVPAALLLCVQSAWAENRLALVIGQSAYKSVPALPNPGNDAKAVAQLLTDSGFEVSQALRSVAEPDARRPISEFAGKVAAKGADTIALVFYAGHGLQIDGENFLVPVDVDPKREADIPIQAVRLNDVLNTLTSVPSRMRILLLDACRNNPFPDISKTAGGGLAHRRRQDRRAEYLPVVFDLAGRDRRRRQRRRQPVHHGAAGGGQGAGDSDRGNLQARARVGQQGDRWAADAVGQFSR